MTRTFRRAAVAALFAFVLSIVVGVVSPGVSSAAKIGNPGSSFSLRVQAGQLRVKTNSFEFTDEGRQPQCSDGSNNDDGQDSAVDFPGDGQCTSATDDSEVQGGFQPKLPILMNNGSISAAGAVTFPTSGISFPPQYLWVAASEASAGIIDDFVVTIQIQPLANFTGTLNANTGAMDLRMQVRVRATGGPLAADCQISPVDINALITSTTAPPGPNTPISGIPYDPGTGRVTVVNNSFSVPGASNCGSVFFQSLDDAINDELGLPSAAGNNEAQFLGEFTPTRPTAGVVATFTTTPSSGPAPLTVSFNSAGSTSGAGVTYQWDFTNNGSFDASGATTSFTYTTPGTRTARLRVTDSAGDFVETTRTITAGSNAPPTADDQTVSTPEETARAITLTGSDPEGQPLSYALSSPSAAHGSVTGTPPNVTYTPATNYNGPDSFGFTVTDNFGNVDAGLVTVNVTPVNDAPTASNVSASTTEDNAVGVLLVGNDIDGDALTYTIVSPPTKGGLSGTAPNLTYTPNAHENGVDTFTYKVTDTSNADSNVATGTITIGAVNDAPTADDQHVDTNEDTAVGITLTGSDVEPGTLTFGIVSPPSHGSLSGALPNLTYTPAAQYHGPDSFVFRVTDSSAATDTATVDIDVASVNDAPTAVGTSVSTTQDTPVTAHITANDIDGDALTYTPTSPTAGGGTVVCTGADCEYTPASGFFGSDSFDVTVDDGNGGNVTVNVAVSVSVLNNTAPSIADATIVTIEDTARTFTPSVSDADGDPVAVSVAMQPSGGSVSCASNTCTFTPNAHVTATQTFVLRADDGRGGVTDATITVLIAPVNDVPNVAPASLTIDEDTTGTVQIVANDVDGDTLTIVVKQAALRGSVSCTTAGACTYTPLANFNGSDSFDVEVTDGHNGRVRMTVPVDVNGVNDAPAAGTVNVSLNEDGSSSFNLTASDIDGPSITFAASPAVKGALTCDGGGGCTFVGNPNENGTETVAYTVSDGTATTTGSIVIVIAPVNDAPSAPSFTVSTGEDTAVSFTLPATDADAGDPLTVTLTSAPGQGSLSGVPPTLTYQPAPNASGTVAFGYRATDLAGASSTGVVTIVVNAVDDAPVANSSAVTTPEDTATAIALTGSDTEGPVTISVTDPPDHGTYSSGVYTPALHYNGPDSIGFSVTDSANQVTPGTVSITVTPVNDPPTATISSVTTTRAVPVAVTLQAADVDGEALAYTVLTGPSKGTLSGTAPNLTYTPTGFYVGPDALTFKVTDGAGVTASATVNISVTHGGAMPTTLTLAPATVTKPTGLLGSLQQYKYTGLSATLRTVAGNLPVAGMPVKFAVLGTQICTATTNASGVATCNGQGPRKDSPTYNGSFVGNLNYAGSTGTGTLS